MNRLTFINLKIITIVLAALSMFTLVSFAQSPILVQIELSLAETADKDPRATISFEMEGRKASASMKNLLIDGNKITFSTDFQGAEIRFNGSLTGDKLGGTIDVFEKGQSVATGTWELSRNRDTSKNFSGTWKGAFSAQPIPSQRADTGYDVHVVKPAYTKKRPKVLFDEAHNNIHTASGLYKPFTDLVTNDGYVIFPNKERFQASTLNGFDVLIIVNAAGPRGHRSDPAFTDEECGAVRDWVIAGGALLFIADHAPMGAAAEILAKRFDVDMSKGYTDDISSKDKVLGDILFSRENELLADSIITRGRNASERISRVITFTGQSLKGPATSLPLLMLPKTAVDMSPQTKQSVSAAGRSQGISLKFGKGRVVVLGEAAMLTAQIDDKGRVFGMNYPNTDNKQFALNVMHWLSRLLK